GVMKNAVDWASRPPRDAALDGKPVAIIGASPGVTGTARGQSQLRQAFEFTNSYATPQPELLVFRANEKFDSEGKLTDETTREHLRKFLEAFRAWTLQFKSSQSREFNSRHLEDVSGWCQHCPARLSRSPT